MVIGTVGHSLIEQISSQQERLKRERGLMLNVVGIANGHKALFTRRGIDCLTIVRNWMKKEYLHLLRYFRMRLLA